MVMRCLFDDVMSIPECKRLQNVNVDYGIRQVGDDLYVIPPKIATGAHIGTPLHPFL
jgi:hypothetical protein